MSANPFTTCWVNGLECIGRDRCGPVPRGMGRREGCVKYPGGIVQYNQSASGAAMTAAADRERADDLMRTLLTARYGEKDEEAIAFASNLVAQSFAAIRREALLRSEAS